MNHKPQDCYARCRRRSLLLIAALATFGVAVQDEDRLDGDENESGDNNRSRSLPGSSSGQHPLALLSERMHAVLSSQLGYQTCHLCEANDLELDMDWRPEQCGLCCIMLCRDCMESQSCDDPDDAALRAAQTGHEMFFPRAPQPRPHLRVVVRRRLLQPQALRAALPHSICKHLIHDFAVVLAPSGV